MRTEYIMITSTARRSASGWGKLLVERGKLSIDMTAGFA